MPVLPSMALCNTKIHKDAGLAQLASATGSTWLASAQPQQQHWCWQQHQLDIGPTTLDKGAADLF